MFDLFKKMQTLAFLVVVKSDYGQIIGDLCWENQT